MYNKSYNHYGGVRMSGQLALNEQGLRNRTAWESAGFSLPRYDRTVMAEATRKNPVWLHFGAGNIFKAFQANAAQKLLNDSIMTTGIIAVERSDSGGKRQNYEAHDNYTLLVTLKADGSIEKTVIGSIAETRFLFSKDPAEYARLREIFTAPSLQMVSFTITEKGYAIEDGKGQLLPAAASDRKAGPENAESYMGKLAALLYERFKAGALPVAMVSMDNCSHNGDKLRAAVSAFARAWAENGLVEREFVDYIESGAKVSFPWTMIDKITPSPDAHVAAILKEDGLADMDASVTSSGTHIAPFVNAEESEYLVIEDDFPNGRPALEKAGFLFTNRDTVNKVERMKVCTCLNPLHTALAIYGCLLGCQKISEEMKDPELLELVRRIGYQEGLPVVEDPVVMEPKAFLDTVLNVRLPNPFMPDTPQRIATDTSQKLAIRFGETIKAYLASDTLDVRNLKLIPLVFAGWLRYLMAVDDTGAAFTPSPDPMMESAAAYVSGFQLGDGVSPEDAEKRLSGILSDSAIWGVNLVESGLSGLVCQYFTELIAGTGAVRATLKKYVTGGEAK